MHLGSPWWVLKTLEFLSKHVYSIVTIKHETTTTTPSRQAVSLVICSHDSHYFLCPFLMTGTPKIGYPKSPQVYHHGARMKKATLKYKKYPMTHFFQHPISMVTKTCGNSLYPTSFRLGAVFFY